MTNRLEAMGQSKYTGLTVLNKAGDRHFNGQVRTHDDALAIPLKWKKPRKVFVNSMSDLFHKDVPFEFIDKVFAVMALSPQHTFQVLTKRPDRMAEYFADGNPGSWDTAIDSLPFEREITINDDHPFLETRRDHTDEYYTASKRGMWPLPNVWLGTSVGNQEAADKRIPHLLKVPAAVRFLSVEPLLGPVDLCKPMPGPDLDQGGGQKICQPWFIQSGIDWVIVGGESGPGSRAMHPQWATSLRDQCVAAGVPFFFKQWGEYQPLSTTDGKQKLPFGDYILPSANGSGFGFIKKGKTAAGRLLDGREWNEMPKSGLK